MEYRYTGNTSLDKPHHYQYSAFEGKGFIAAYLQNRTMAIEAVGGTGKNRAVLTKEELESWIALMLSTSVPDIPAYREYLASPPYKAGPLLLLTGQEIVANGLHGSEVVRVTETFNKRYEVFKRIYAEYDLDFRKLGNNYKNLDGYLALAVCLAAAYINSHNMKYLNALLKVHDMLCAHLAEIRAGQRPMMRRSLALEVDFVKTLIAQKKIKVQYA